MSEFDKYIMDKRRELGPYFHLFVDEYPETGQYMIIGDNNGLHYGDEPDVEFREFGVSLEVKIDYRSGDE